MGLEDDAHLGRGVSVLADARAGLDVADAQRRLAHHQRRACGRDRGLLPAFEHGRRRRFRDDDFEFIASFPREPRDVVFGGCVAVGVAGCLPAVDPHRVGARNPVDAEDHLPVDPCERHGEGGGERVALPRPSVQGRDVAVFAAGRRRGLLRRGIDRHTAARQLPAAGGDVLLGEQSAGGKKGYDRKDDPHIFVYLSA